MSINDFSCDTRSRFNWLCTTSKGGLFKIRPIEANCAKILNSPKFHDILLPVLFAQRFLSNRINFRSSPLVPLVKKMSEDLRALEIEYNYLSTQINPENESKYPSIEILCRKGCHHWNSLIGSYRGRYSKLWRAKLLIKPLERKIFDDLTERGVVNYDPIPGLRVVFMWFKCAHWFVPSSDWLKTYRVIEFIWKYFLQKMYLLM